jgi:hypothetical protein
LRDIDEEVAIHGNGRNVGSVPPFSPRA